jgi:hypothetical protein
MQTKIKLMGSRVKGWGVESGELKGEKEMQNK